MRVLEGEEARWARHLRFPATAISEACQEILPCLRGRLPKHGFLGPLIPRRLQLLNQLSPDGEAEAF